MAAGNFIKDNLALVAGIAIPVLLVTGFLLTSTLGKLLTPPPAYTAYFVMQADDGAATRQSDLGITLDDAGKIIVSVSPVTKDSNGYRPHATADVLVSYDAVAGTLRQHPVTPPPAMTRGSFTPDTLKALRLNPQARAADGYDIAYGRRGEYSLVADIFVARSAAGYRIRKGSAVYRLPERDPTDNAYNRYYNLRFLGWGTEKNQ